MTKKLTAASVKEALLKQEFEKNINKSPEEMINDLLKACEKMKKDADLPNCGTLHLNQPFPVSDRLYEKLVNLKNKNK